MNYLNNYTPDDYRCSRCNIRNVKLWRESYSFTIVLLCVTCTCITQNKNIDIDVDGMYQSRCGRTDQIGWYLPAVPTEDERSYWGYTSVPEIACSWWKRLPTRK
jgi:hypothetical protein